MTEPAKPETQEPKPNNARPGQLGEKWVGGAETAGLDEDTYDLENLSGPIIVGDKRFLLKVGIFFTALGQATCLFLFYNIGGFPPLVFLLALMSFGMVVFLFRLKVAPHVLKLDNQGLDDRTQGYASGFTPWSEIVSCQVVQADGRTMLGLTLTDESVQRRDFLSQTYMGEQRQSLGCDVILPPEVFGFGKAERYAAFMQDLIDKPQRREQLTAKEPS